MYVYFYIEYSHKRDSYGKWYRYNGEQYTSRGRAIDDVRALRRVFDAYNFRVMFH